MSGPDMKAASFKLLPEIAAFDHVIGTGPMKAKDTN